MKIFTKQNRSYLLRFGRRNLLEVCGYATLSLLYYTYSVRRTVLDKSLTKYFKIPNEVSSNGRHTNIGDFAEVEHVLQEIMSDPAICGEYDCRSLFRTADPMTMRTRGASAVTGDSHGCFLEWYSCTIINPLYPQGAVNSDCIACSNQIAESHVDLFMSAGLWTTIENVARVYGVDPWLISALISKLTRAGAGLDADGFIPCGSPAGCYGVMRVPIEYFNNFGDPMVDDPFSEVAIIAGIELLFDVVECVCQNTGMSMRKSVEDIIMISKSVARNDAVYFRLSKLLYRIAARG